MNSISFTPDASHIITVSSDGTIGIVRCGNWQVEKHWLQPHKGLGVDTLAVHPTGKLAMTTGHDGVLRTWNLVKGRQAYATNLIPRWKLDAKNISVLKWSPTGNGYLIGANNKMDVYSIETAGVEEEMKFDTKISCAEYLNDEFIAIGLSDGKICIYDLSSSTKIEIQAHNSRVKCFAKDEDVLASASSSGEIKLWTFEDNKLTLISEANCSARITCITLTKNLIMKKKDEVEVEETIPEKLINKLRLKQKVIIEDEGDEKIVSRMSKKQRDKKKARKLLEEVNVEDEVEDETISKSKKIKMQSIEKSLSKKKKSSESDLPFESQKKKKRLSDSPKKRKSLDSIDDDITELPIKKKKQKEQKGENTTKVNPKSVTETKNIKVIVNKNEKKRKNPPEESVENSPKKIKPVAGTALLKKKRKKKIFKSKIIR